MAEQNQAHPLPGSPRDLSAALLEFDAGAAPVSDTRRQVQNVLRRDRRRVRVLTGLAVALWLAAAGGIGSLVYVGYAMVFPKLKSAAFQPERVPRAEAQALHTYVVGVGATLLGVSVCILALATLFTLLLVLASRRATLRQVNAGLLEVTEQLKQLRRALEGRGQSA